jgi:nucleotide-binding universal stress UspA family protein
MSTEELQPVSRRILVVANQPVAGEDLHDIVDAEVVVVAPALIGRLGYWTGDDRRSRRDAEERLELSLESLRKSGLEVSGSVGDADPLQAIEDALREFDADAIVVATHPEGCSNWLATDILGRAQRRFSRPIAYAEGSGVSGRCSAARSASA